MIYVVIISRPAVVAACVYDSKMNVGRYAENAVLSAMYQVGRLASPDMDFLRGKRRSVDRDVQERDYCCPP